MKLHYTFTLDDGQKLEFTVNFDDVSPHYDGMSYKEIFDEEKFQVEVSPDEQLSNLIEGKVTGKVKLIKE